MATTKIPRGRGEKDGAKPRSLAVVYAKIANPEISPSKLAEMFRYAKHSGAVTVCKILARPWAKKMIAEASAKALTKAEVTRERVIQELVCVAFADLRELIKVDSNGVKIKDSSKWTDNQARAIAEVSESETKDSRNLRVKYHDKLKALELLGKYLKMWNEVGSKDNPLTGKLLTQFDHYIIEATKAEAKEKLAALENSSNRIKGFVESANYNPITGSPR